MNQHNIKDPLELESLLKRMRSLSAPASLRQESSGRILGDLQVHGLELGFAMHLSGARFRDQIPPKDSAVTLTVLLGEEVHSVRTVTLDPILSTDGDTHFPPVLRVAWPTQAMECHRRRDLRVATPDLPSLEAVLITGGRRISARLLNLTETGMGLGLRDPTPLAIHSAVVVETHLPGGTPFKTSGEVRHSEVLADDPLPGRVGLVLGDIGPECREALRRFVQARRMDRSATLRKAIPSRNGRK